ncbi:MAG: extracellular solute-binding protein [Chloroflexi bacterium]|nr:extracellular solute-binding protein [Chloroflexota bacterium]
MNYHRSISRRGLLRVAGGAAIGAGLAACASSGSASPSPAAQSTGQTGAAGSTAVSASIKLGGTINFMGFDGEDGPTVAKDWLAQNGLTVNATYMAGNDDIVNKLKLGGGLDIAAPNNGYIPILAAAGYIRALDLSRIPNRAHMYQVLQDAPWTRNDKGEVVSIPMLWGDVPFVYDPARVPEVPKLLLELGDAKWHKQVVWLDDPIGTIWSFATAMGFNDPTHLTADDLAKVVATMTPIIKNGVAVAGSFGDQTDYIVRGEASLAYEGWEAQINQAKAKGVELKYGFFEDAGYAWCDNFAIPTTAVNVDGAYAFINYMLSPEANAKLATSLSSAVTNLKAYDLLGADIQALYDYKVVTDPASPVKIENVYPPLTQDPKYTNVADWIEAWSKAKL